MKSSGFNNLQYILFALFAFTLFPASAQNANELLDKAAASYKNANGISASFALHVRGEGGAESFEGTIQMKGDKFALSTPDMQIWYDGRTQWNYVERNREVYVTEPTEEELQYINPTLLLNNYQKGYTAAYKGESTASNGKSAYDIELTPRKKGDILKVVLQLEKSSSLPARISIDAKNGIRTTIQIDQLTTGVNQPDSVFVFNEKEYPDADIID